MSKLILLRHGESLWNKANLFTGWVDVPLSENGIQEAIDAGTRLKDMPIDIIFTSTLMRAKQTAMLALSRHSSGKTPIMQAHDDQHHQWNKIYSSQTQQNTIPAHADWRLNERYYGALQGCNKDETRAKYGEEQVKIWRRSYDISPPDGESLQTTVQRTLPCFQERIEPELEKGSHVLVAAHGNSLRSIVMHLEKLSSEEILSLELPTGQPRIYSYNQGSYTLEK